MKKNKEKVLQIKCTLFRFKILYFNCNSSKQFIRMLGETKYETDITEEILTNEITMKAEGACFYTNQGPIIFASKNKKENVMHEVAHAVINICDSIGIPINQENSETFCYILAYIIEKIYEGGNK